MAATKTNDLTVYVQVDNRGEYKVIKCWLMKISGGGLRRFSEPDGLGEVVVYGQTDRGRLADPAETLASIMYATGLYYGTGSDIGLNEWGLRKGLKLVSKLNARLKKIEEQYGRPASFGTLVHRFAKVVGAKTMTIERTPEGREMTGCAYRTDDAMGASWTFIDAVLQQWMAEARHQVA
jgi:hypothetical protein